jgi:hypothetical protein
LDTRGGIRGCPGGDHSAKQTQAGNHHQQALYSDDLAAVFELDQVVGSDSKVAGRSGLVLGDLVWGHRLASRRED